MLKKVRYDTRNKKPNVWDITYLVILTVVSELVISRLNSPHAELYADLVMIVFYIAIGILLLRARRKQMEYNPYSYNTIYYTAFAILSFTTVLYQIYVTYIYYISGLIEESRIFFVLQGAIRFHGVLITPFLLVFSIAMIISNISLIRHEGRNFVNLLGVILSVMILAGILMRPFSNMSGSEQEVLIRSSIYGVFESVFAYYLCMLIGTMYAAWTTAMYEPDKDKDFIIILGCGLKPDGRPTPLLTQRIERALQFYHDQLKETGKKAKFITSGGKGADEAVSESESMKNYLIEKGIPEEDILMEDRSTNTLENMRNSRDIIWSIDPHAKVVFSTSRYHVFRSGIKARFVKLRAQGIGADTKWYFWPNAAVREFIGLLSEHRGKQALILLGIIVLNILFLWVTIKG